MMIREMTREALRAWLLDYAWMGTEDEKRRTVDCIMSQENELDVLEARADKYAGAQAEPGPEAFADGEAFALSALYECHDGPHLRTCPDAPNPMPREPASNYDCHWFAMCERQATHWEPADPVSPWVPACDECPTISSNHPQSTDPSVAHG